MCRSKCSTKIPEEERKELFEEYWHYRDISKQRQFITNSVSIIPKKRSQGKENTRVNTIKHKLNEKFVCKTMFLNTFAISEKVARTAIDKCDLNHIVEEDRRGKSANRKFSQDVIEEVKTHKEFPNNGSTLR